MNGVKEFLKSDWYQAAVFNPSEGKLMPYGKENPDKKNPLYSIFIEPNECNITLLGVIRMSRVKYILLELKILNLLTRLRTISLAI